MSDPVLAYLETESSAILERLLELVRIPSVSTDPTYAQGMAALGVWAIGVSVRKIYAIEAHTGLSERVLPVTLHDLDYGKLK